MARQIYVDLNVLARLNASSGLTLPVYNTEPIGLAVGDIYYNSVDTNIYRFDGVNWLNSAGTSGTDGTSGSSGSSGSSGTDGTSGSSGTNGTSGTSGSSGLLPSIGLTQEIVYRDDSATYNYNTSTGLTYDGDMLSVDHFSALGGYLTGLTYIDYPIPVRDGTSGTDGTSGSSGTSGLSGVNGSSGSSGLLPVIGSNTELVYRDSTAPYNYNTSTGLTYGSNKLQIKGSGTLLDVNNGSTTVLSVVSDGSINVNGIMYNNTSSITGLTTGTNVISSILKTLGKAAHIDYYVLNGSTMRAGTIIATWNGTNSIYTDYCTIDLDGSTEGVVLSVDISGSNVRVLATISSGTWNIKLSIKII